MVWWYTGALQFVRIRAIPGPQHAYLVFLAFGTRNLINLTSMNHISKGKLQSYFSLSR
uniref:Uncharacterized protein n=1 Tax=Arundo donax TaxID=35708 RepID=A0A0A8YXD3_ARUDO